MKKVLLLTIILVLGAVLVNLLGQMPAYVGAAKCKICHQTEKQGQQYPIWEKSNHAQSAAVLSTEKATPVAQQMGVQKPAEDAKCLTCHSPLFEKSPELKAEGISCEVCHGPGSEYKKLSVMKDKDEAIKAGLILYANPDAIKAKCLTCHEKDHGKTFDFAAAWEKIKHTIPGK